MREIKSYEQFFNQHPLYRLLILFCTGCWLGDCFYSVLSAKVLLVLAVLFATAIAAYCCRKKQPFLFSVATLVFLLSFGALWLTLDRSSIETTWPPRPAAYKAIVLTPPHRTPQTQHLRLCLVSGKESGKKVDIVLMTDSTAAVLKPGDALMFYAVVEKPHNAGNPDEFDYAAYLRHNGVSGTAFCFSNQWKHLPSEQAELTNRLPLLAQWQLKALQVQLSLSQKFVQYLPTNDAGILAAMTVGDKSMLNKDVHMLYAETGISHVLALSGLHLGILIGLLTLFKPRRRGARIVLVLLQLLLVGCFTFIAGLPLSLVRAALMFTILNLGQLFYRGNGSTIDGLGVAVFLILMVSPQSVFDVGLQLSFLAVLFIGLFYGPLSSQLMKKEMPNYMRKLISFVLISLVAQAGTAPLAAYYFHRVPLYFLLANAIAIPMATLVLTLSIPFLLVPYAPVVAFAARLLHYISHYANAGFQAIAALPYSYVDCYPTLFTVLFLYAALVGLIIAFHQRRRLPLLIGLSFLTLGCSTELYTHRPNALPAEIVFYNNRSCSAVHFIASPQSSYLWTQADERKNGMNYIAQTFWKTRGIATPHRLSQADATYADLLMRRNIIRFNHRTVVLLTGKDWSHKKAAHPLRCDLAFAAKGFRGHLYALKDLFTPRTLVLDARLSDYYREQYTREARLLGWKVYDIKEQGALIVR